MTDLTVFTYSDQQVRTVTINGEPWFVAADICSVLQIGRVHDAVRGLDDDEKGADTIRTPGGDQEVTVVSEPGVYSLVLRSRKPEAKAFKRWITHEVLPTIRKTGGFAIPETRAGALRLAADLEDQLTLTRHQLAEQAPKVAAYEQLMDADGYFTVEATAKLIQVGRNTLFSKLRDDRILQANNLPYQRWMHLFVITTSTYEDRYGAAHVSHTTRVRPTGLDWLAKRYAAPRPMRAIES